VRSFVKCGDGYIQSGEGNVKVVLCVSGGKFWSVLVYIYR